jgi:CubicO group peptidase (beta-lactamase class C family)
MRSIGRYVGAGVVATLLSVSCAPLASAHTLPGTYKFTPNPQVDEVFAKFDSTTSPGCSAAVAKDGKLIYSRGYGMANLDHSIPNTPQTPFHVASVSKQFTAASIVLLAQEGKLSLDDDVRKYLPEVPDLGATVTLRQLIHHTSGVRDQWELLGLAGWRYSLDRINDDDVLRLMTRQRKLNFAPNSRYLYSNMGYTLLALVVKRVSGQSLREFTTERIFKPLGMGNSHFRNEHAEIVPGFANGYERADDSFKTSVTNFDTTGATSLLTTAEDLLRWDENFYTGQVGGAAFTEQMLERGVLSDGEKIPYAFGLMHDTYRGLETVGHGGADAGYRATVLRFPKQHFGVTVACNIAEAQPDVLAKGIADVYLSAQLQPKTEKDLATPKPIKVSAKALHDKVGVYLNRLDGQFLRVVEKDGRLQTLRPSGSSQGLIPVGANRFRFEPFPAAVFEFSGAGEQRTVTTRVGEQKPTTFVSVPEFSPTPTELNEYAGLFASEELDARYRMLVKDGSLHMATLKSNPMPLQVVTKDVFANPFSTITFVRDSGGRITGCSVSSGRAWNNEFVKLAE